MKSGKSFLYCIGKGRKGQWGQVSLWGVAPLANEIWLE